MKLDPAALGFPSGRRRTRGLRREEVAQRANISPTWHTWLEQGRRGAPSAKVLDALDPCPALIRTAIWDVLAWNEAAAAMLMDYGSLPPE